jgi:hypothetical protein
MNAQQHKSSGFLGRGPGFWLGLVFATTLSIAGLKLTGAIESRSALMLLLIVPPAQLVALYKSAQNQASSGDGTCTAKNAAQKRYLKRVAIATSLYLATFALMTFLDGGFAVPEPVRYFVAVLPGLALIGIFWAIGRLIVEEQDEFLRMLTIRQTLIASAIALSAASIWGFLEAADLVVHIDAYWYTVIWFLGIGVGAIVNRIEYGSWGAV